MKNSPPPLHSRYPPRKLLLFLLCNTHPAIGVMGSVRRKNTTRLFNKTDKIMVIREFRGLLTCESDFISKITVEAGNHTDIDSTKYVGGDSQGGRPSKLKIFCNGSFLRSSGGDLVLPGDEFIHFETVTIVPAAVEDQNSTGVVNYEVKFQPRDASVVSAKSLKVSRDSVLDHDNGWSVQHFEDGSVKLTRNEGMTMTLNPAKLFARNIVKDPETVLLGMVLKFWPRTFADLNRKDDLGRTVRVVNDLMRQTKLYNVDQSKVEVAMVVENVRVLNELRASKVEWYRPLFPGMRFPPVAETMAEVDQEKLKKFATTIEPLLRRPNSSLGRSSRKS